MHLIAFQKRKNGKVASSQWECDKCGRIHNRIEVDEW